MKLRLIAIAAALLPLTGCLTPSTISPTLYYTIEPEVETERKDPSELALGLRPLRVAEPYDVRMAYRGPDHVLGYRSGVEWAEQPGTVMTRALIDGFEATGFFADLGDASNLARPDWILTGQLRKFHEDRTKEPPEAVIEVRIAVRPAREVEAHWTGVVSAAVPLAGTGPGDLAEAMSRAIADVVEHIVAAVIP